MRYVHLGGLALAVALIAVVVSAGSSDAAGATVTIKNFQFAPTPITVGVGQTVTWVNRDIGDHKIIFNDGVYPASGLLGPGQRYTVKMKRVGTVSYSDGVAGFMTGTIFVIPGAAPTPPPKATTKPAPKPTPKPTAKPTAKPVVTAKPTAKASAASSTTPAVAESPGQSGAPPAGGSIAGSGAGGTGSTNASDSSGPAGMALVLGLIAFALLAGIGVAIVRRNRPGPLSGANDTPVAALPLARPPVSPPLPPLPAPPRDASARRPRNDERPAVGGPTYPYDVDEDAPIKARQPGGLTEDDS